VRAIKPTALDDLDLSAKSSWENNADPTLQTLLAQLTTMRDAQALYDSGSVQGSGFILSDQGEIVTTAHLVNNAAHVIVQLHDGKKYPAQIIGIDTLADIALLQINESGLTSVRIGDSQTLEPGDWLFAIGSPYELHASVSQGIVSALNRYLSEANILPLIQSDVVLNPGNSGGPLFDEHGKVVGINAQIYSENGGYSGLSFAIPINQAIAVTDTLRRSVTREYGWVGIALQDLDESLAQAFGLSAPTGVLVTLVAAGSHADKAGLREGDVIQRFNGQPISNAAQLIGQISQISPGQTVPFSIWRSDRVLEIETAIEPLPPADKQRTPAPHGEFIPLLQISILDLSQTDRESFGVGARGVMVEQVAAGPALNSGLEAGDIILAFNNQAVTNSAGLQTQVSDLAATQPVPLLILRGEGVFYLALNLL